MTKKEKTTDKQMELMEWDGKKDKEIIKWNWITKKKKYTIYINVFLKSQLTLVEEKKILKYYTMQVIDQPAFLFTTTSLEKK